MKKIAILLVFLSVLSSCGGSETDKNSPFLSIPDWLIGSWDQKTTPTTVAMTFSADDIFYSDRYGDYLYSEKFGNGYTVTQKTGVVSDHSYYEVTFLDVDGNTLFFYQYVLWPNKTTLSLTYKKINTLSSIVLIDSSTNIYRL